VLNIEKQYKRGFITDDERYRLVVSEWEQTTKDVTNALQDCLDEYNPIYMMANSGARGSMAQIRQLAGMRGLMANTSGKTIEIPIKANYREGLTVLEYFVSSRGARKGLADTALRTADSGYLTRRMVDVSQDVIIREEDCGTTRASWPPSLRQGPAGPVLRRQHPRPLSRAAHHRSQDRRGAHIPRTTCSRRATPQFWSHGITQGRRPQRAELRGPQRRVRQCYGINLALGKPVNAGEAVGVIAAQSIGEPGTQLTMRTFHTGGVAGDDITQGLPRVEELFEARKPKKMAILSEISGTVTVEETKKGVMSAITVTNEAEGDKQFTPRLTPPAFSCTRATMWTRARSSPPARSIPTMCCASAASTTTSSAVRACAPISLRRSRRCTASRASISTTSTSRSSCAR
jgi:DNA-directed RNA polymerase subunit beta'